MAAGAAVGAPCGLACLPAEFVEGRADCHGA